jgi:hypothetical protein
MCLIPRSDKISGEEPFLRNVDESMNKRKLFRAVHAVNSQLGLRDIGRPQKAGDFIDRGELFVPNLPKNSCSSDIQASWERKVGVVIPVLVRIVPLASVRMGQYLPHQQRAKFGRSKDKVLPFVVRQYNIWQIYS